MGTRSACTNALRLLALLALLALPVGAAGAGEGAAAAPDSRTIPLSGEHLFRAGDDPRYADPAHDDSGWRRVPVPASWRRFGVDEHVDTAWYRIRFTVPPGFEVDRPALHLALLLVADETYLNGRRIGGEGEINRAAWHDRPPFLPRLYPIDPALLDRDGPNVLAIRVNRHPLIQDGGLPLGPVEIGSYVDLAPEAGARVLRYQAFSTVFLGIDTVIIVFALSAFWLGLRDRAMKSFLLMFTPYFLAQVEKNHAVHAAGLGTPLVEAAVTKLAALLLVPLLEFVAAVLKVPVGRTVRVVQGLTVVSVLNNPAYTTEAGAMWYRLCVQVWTLAMFATFAIIGWWILRAALARRTDVMPMVAGLAVLIAGVLSDVLLPATPMYDWFGVTFGDPCIHVFLLSLAMVLGIRMFRTEQALKAANDRALRLHESERGRLAREVHDGIGQWLSTIKLNLNILRARKRGGADPDAGAFDELVDDVSHAIEDTRRIAHDLSPALLDRFGLVEAMRSLADRISRERGIEVSVTAQAGPPVADKAGSHLYRIFQEAVRNAIEHGRCTRIETALAREGGELVLTVRDDGIGLDGAAETASKGQAKDAADTAAGLGLRNMRERAMLLGGTFEAGAAKGGGTVITVRAPAD